ncbi:hypothetical protein D3C85_1874010 [compost metagenome]
MHHQLGELCTVRGIRFEHQMQLYGTYNSITLHGNPEQHARTGHPLPVSGGGIFGERGKKADGGSVLYDIDKQRR